MANPGDTASARPPGDRRAGHVSSGFSVKLTEEAARKLRMRTAGVDPADPAARWAWEAEHYAEGDCSYCGRALTLDATAPEPEQLWRDAWMDADCPDSPDGLHTLNEIHDDGSPVMEAELHQRALDAMSPPGRAEFSRAVRELRDQAGLTTAEERNRCMYCGVAGPAERFQVAGPLSASVACRNWRACEVRQRGGNLAETWLELTRAIGGDLRYLSDYDRAVVDLFGKQAGWAAMGSMGSGSRQALLDVRRDHGCRACGAIGTEPCLVHPDEDTVLSRPSWARRPPKGRHASHRPWA